MLSSCIEREVSFWCIYASWKSHAHMRTHEIYFIILSSRRLPPLRKAAAWSARSLTPNPYNIYHRKIIKFKNIPLACAHAHGEYCRLLEKKFSKRLKKVNPMKFFPKIFAWFREMSYLCNVIQQEWWRTRSNENRQETTERSLSSHSTSRQTPATEETTTRLSKPLWTP